MKFTKDHWIQKGVEFLANEGSHALMIDHMCAKSRITKGSFYHYFDSIDEYIRLVVRRWEREILAQLEKVVEKGLSPQQRLDRMKMLAFHYSGKLEVGLRALALHNREVKKILNRTESKRVEMLTQILSDLGKSKLQAREIAELIYAQWIGIQVCQISGVINAERVTARSEMIMKMF